MSSISKIASSKSLTSVMVGDRPVWRAVSGGSAGHFQANARALARNPEPLPAQERGELTPHDSATPHIQEAVFLPCVEDAGSAPQITASRNEYNGSRRSESSQMKGDQYENDA